MTGSRIITSAVHIQHRIIRRHQSLQHGGEMKNVKVNKPTLLTDSCIKYWGQVRRREYNEESTNSSLNDMTPTEFIRSLQNNEVLCIDFGPRSQEGNYIATELLIIVPMKY